MINKLYVLLKLALPGQKHASSSIPKLYNSQSYCNEKQQFPENLNETLNKTFRGNVKNKTLKN